MRTRSATTASMSDLRTGCQFEGLQFAAEPRQRFFEGRVRLLCVSRREQIFQTIRRLPSLGANEEDEANTKDICRLPWTRRSRCFL